jgi:hypothetical protein
MKDPLDFDTRKTIEHMMSYRVAFAV